MMDTIRNLPGASRGGCSAKEIQAELRAGHVATGPDGE